MRFENLRIPMGTRSVGEESWWKRVLVGVVEFMTCLVEHSISGFLFLSTIFVRTDYYLLLHPLFMH